MLLIIGIVIGYVYVVHIRKNKDNKCTLTSNFLWIYINIKKVRSECAPKCSVLLAYAL